MGYSCTQDADHMLGVIRKAYGDPTRGSNVLSLRGGYLYFYERGRENVDGAITGTLMRMSASGDYAYRSGSFRINPDGTIGKFPYLSKIQRQELENTFRDMQSRNPELLRSWAMGVL